MEKKSRPPGKETEALRSRIAELEEQLAQSRKEARLFKSLADQAPDMIWAKDLQKRYIFTNRALREKLLMAGDAEEPLGRDDLFFAHRERATHPEDPQWHTFGEICTDSDQVVIDTQEPGQFDEYGNVRGKFLFLDVRKAPLLDDDGKMVGIVGNARIVTRERQVEKELKKNALLLHSILDAIPELVSVHDRDFRVVYSNWHDHDYIREEERRGNPLCYKVYMHREEPCEFCHLEEVFRTGKSSRVVRTNPVDASTREINTIPIRNEQGEVVLVAEHIRNITTQIEMEHELKEALEHYRLIFEQSPYPIVIHHQGIITAINQEALRLAEVESPAEIIGRPALDFVHPDYRETAVRRIQEILSNPVKQPLIEEKFITARGTELDVEVMAMPFKEKGEIQIMVVIRDITARKRAEENHRHLEAHIQQAQKLESLGVLAGGIAHDFNNLLTGILGNVGLAEISLSPLSPALENIKRVEKSAVRAADLCRQLLAYSGKGRFVIQAVDLNEIVGEMTHLLEASISKKALLKYQLADNLPPVEVDATQIRQVIMNLIINASDAIGEKSGIITVATGAQECDRAYLREAYLDEHLTPGNYVYLEVSDTGCGMEEETLKRIFDPFFTTKFTGRGLGLAAVLGIIRGHKGAIKVYSEPGKGTSFKVLLPFSDKSVRLETVPTDDFDQLHGEGTILVVDDEDTIRTLGRNTLESKGFRVLTAADGREAVEVYRQHHEEIRLVLLDMTMPHLSGEEVFREMRHLNPGIKVVLSSGYNEQEATNRFVGKGLAGFLQKPYKPDGLLEIVFRVLDNEGEPS